MQPYLAGAAAAAVLLYGIMAAVSKIGRCHNCNQRYCQKQCYNSFHKGSVSTEPENNNDSNNNNNNNVVVVKKECCQKSRSQRRASYTDGTTPSLMVNPLVGHWQQEHGSFHHFCTFQTVEWISHWTKFFSDRQRCWNCKCCPVTLWVQMSQKQGLRCVKIWIFQYWPTILANMKLHICKGKSELSQI